jgi:putative tricarboxylic transport membrane protein
MKIRWLLIALCIMFAFGLAACGGQADKSSTGNNGAEQQGSEKEGNTAGDASGYPERNIEIIAGGGPGGGTDLFSRAVAKELGEILGTNVIVINQPGAAGAVASQELARRPADGYSIMPTTSDFQINIAVGRTPNYLEQFEPLARMHDDTYTILVSKDSPYQTIDEFIAAAKEKPGKLTIGGTASLGLDELTVRSFAEMAGIELNYIAYEDAGQMHTALAGGHVDALIEEPGAADALLSDGTFKMLLVFAEDRLEEYPDVPTTAEKGWDLTTGMARGFMIHKDVPEAIRKTLEEALAEVLSRPDYQEFAESQFLHLKDGWLSSEEYRALLEEEVKTFKSLIEKYGGEQ